MTPRIQIPTQSEDLNEEVIVYLVLSPNSGPEHRIYSDESIQAAGGIHAIEQSLEQESYWFVRLGQIQGKASHGESPCVIPTSRSFQRLAKVCGA